MQIPRPYLVKKYNNGNNFFLKEFIVWANCKESAVTYANELHRRPDFCPLQPFQFLTVVEATSEDQKRNLQTFHGHVKV